MRNNAVKLVPYPPDCFSKNVDLPVPRNVKLYMPLAKAVDSDFGSYTLTKELLTSSNFCKFFERRANQTSYSVLLWVGGKLRPAPHSPSSSIPAVHVSIKKDPGFVTHGISLRRSKALLKLAFIIITVHFAPMTCPSWMHFVHQNFMVVVVSYNSTIVDFTYKSCFCLRSRLPVVGISFPTFGMATRRKDNPLLFSNIPINNDPHPNTGLDGALQ